MSLCGFCVDESMEYSTPIPHGLRRFPAHLRCRTPEPKPQPSCRRVSDCILLRQLLLTRGCATGKAGEVRQWYSLNLLLLGMEREMSTSCEVFGGKISNWSIHMPKHSDNLSIVYI